MVKDKVVYDMGNHVACDFCNDDFTNREDTGGCLVGSYAACPACTKTTESRNPEEIDSRCPDGMSFRDWVLSLRGGNNQVRVVSADSYEELAKYMNQ